MHNKIWYGCPAGAGPRPLFAISTNEHKMHEMIAGWVFLFVVDDATISLGVGRFAAFPRMTPSLWKCEM